MSDFKIWSAILSRLLSLFHPKTVAVLFVKIYKIFFSPFLGTNCKYHPSCSSYAIEAFEKKGFFLGLLKTCSRLLRCNPFSSGGYDPVDKN